MFRKMAREKQQLCIEECVGILKTEKRGVLSLLGNDGYPYGVPLNHYYCEEDGKLYFHSGKKGHKIDAIRSCGKASYCVLDKGTRKSDGWALNFRSVIVFGKIEFVSDRDKIYDIAARLSRKFTCDEEYIRNEIEKFGGSTLMFALVPEHVCGKRVNES